jgi:hypothetical protein
LRPADPAWTFSLNPFMGLGDPDVDLVALTDTITTAILQAWGQDRVTETPLIGEVLHNLLYAIGRLSLPLVDAMDFLSRERKREREEHLARLVALDPDAASFWLTLEKLSPNRRDEYLAPVRRRLQPFFASPFVRRIFSQTDRALDVAEEMDRGSVLLVDLRPGPSLSADASRLIGLLLVNEFYTGAFRRKNKRPAYLYIDECQEYLSPNIARILDETRKFSLSFVLAHQHLGHLRQAGEHIYRSVLTNTHVKVVFGGLDPTDAGEMAEVMFRGHFDLQRAKERLYRPTAVGNELVELASGGTTRSSHQDQSKNWSRGKSRMSTDIDSEAAAEMESEAYGVSDAVGTTDGEATIHADNVAEGASESESTAVSHGPQVTNIVDACLGFMMPGGENPFTVTTGSAGMRSQGSSDAVSKQHAATRMHAETHQYVRGTAKQRGHAHAEAQGESESRGGSITKGTAQADTAGWSQAYKTRYEDMPSSLWSLEEQIHVCAVTLAHLPVGQAYVRIGSSLPRRLALPYLDCPKVVPAHVKRLAAELQRAAPFTASAGAVDAAYSEHRQAITAPPADEPEEEPDAEDGVEWK